MKMITPYGTTTTRNVRAQVKRKPVRKVRKDRVFLALIFVIAIGLFFFNAHNKSHKDKVVFIREVNDATSTVENEIMGDTVWGIDISRWQSNTIDKDWLEFAKEKGCRFIYIQFAKSNTDEDSALEQPILDYTDSAKSFAKMAEEVGIHFGFYFLTDSKIESFRLSELGSIMCFVNQIKAEKYSMNTLPLMLDHECYGDAESLEDSASRVEMLTRQVSDLRDLGIKPIVYTSGSKYSELREKLGDDQLFWIADYSIAEKGVAPTSIPDEYSS